MQNTKKRFFHLSKLMHKRKFVKMFTLEFTLDGEPSKRLDTTRFFGFCKWLREHPDCGTFLWRVEFSNDRDSGKFIALVPDGMSDAEIKDQFKNIVK